MFLKKYNLPDPVCLYKWGWSTIHLYKSSTNSCHRVDNDLLTVENYHNFHNTEKKLHDRQMMLEGKWPGRGCEYCRDIEKAGGVSDRLEINDWGFNAGYTPIETFTNSNQVNLTPTMVEVYFSNLCNMGCIYCSSMFSSVIEAEDRKFNLNPDNLRHLDKHKTNYTKMVEAHWEWFKINGKHLKRYHILGGEPFHQTELEKNIDIIFDYPCPDLELAIFTNLKVHKDKMKRILDKAVLLKQKGLIKSFTIFFSIDCWGPEIEYIRHGLNLKQWEENFLIILNEYKDIELIIHSTLISLTMQTYPELCRRVFEWNKVRKVHQSVSFADGRPHMHLDVFPDGFFDKQFDEVLKYSCSKDFTKRIEGFKKRVNYFDVNLKKIKLLKEDLDSIDKRRGTNWKSIWPWLDNYEV